ncbi:DUF917 domain-containing protein [Streptomyces somaliensis]|uniref:DUF917 domain-containing protein n=1 Tax=Streptomyces somaliensis TaxID=78355 RepID=UPI0020CDD28A|nr:DUF917 domain-containing protein [Streptomyces somaliensis]MCP9946905.1 DUF917 domain-containing protein [Streptomyces somaliensis]
MTDTLPRPRALRQHGGRRHVTPDDVEDLAAGAALLGSGGGGDTHTATLLARHQLAEHGPVPLVHLSDLDPDAPVACVGAVGSTTALAERLPGGTEFTTVVDTLNSRLDTPLAALQPLEIGGVNALFALAAAARTGLPLVDADAMGRAFPRLDQTTLSAAGHPASPTALADARGTALTIDVPDNATLELVVREALPALGGWCAIATHPAAARTYLGAVVDRSVTRALCLGAAYLHAAGAPPAVRAAFIARRGGTPLRSGTVCEVRRRETTAGAHTTITVQDRADPARTLRLEAGDEYVLVLDDGVPLAVTPEVICVLDPRTWRLIPPYAVTEHQRVALFALPAAPAWRPPSSSLVGLASYGLRDLPQDVHAPHHGP